MDRLLSTPTHCDRRQGSRPARVHLLTLAMSGLVETLVDCLVQVVFVGATRCGGLLLCEAREH